MAARRPQAAQRPAQRKGSAQKSSTVESATYIVMMVMAREATEEDEQRLAKSMQKAGFKVVMGSIDNAVRLPRGVFRRHAPAAEARQVVVEAQKACAESRVECQILVIQRAGGAHHGLASARIE